MFMISASFSNLYFVSCWLVTSQLIAFLSCVAHCFDGFGKLLIARRTPDVGVRLSLAHHRVCSLNSKINSFFQRQILMILMTSFAVFLEGGHDILRLTFAPYDILNVIFALSILCWVSFFVFQLLYLAKHCELARNKVNMIYILLMIM
jgi:hypothetical protein